MERIDVRDLGSEPVELAWTGSPQALGLEAQGEFRSPVRVNLTARLVGTRVFLTGTAATTVRLECSRCLEAFDLSLVADVKVECREGKPPAPGSEGDDEDVDVTWFEPPYLDAGEEVRQILLLAEPGYPVCRQDCRGLCPVCGANRNEADCGHAQPAPDSRGAGRVIIRQQKERN